MHSIIVNNFKLNLNRLLLPILVKNKLFDILSLLFLFNLRKIKKILPKKKHRYKIIVLGKLAGNEDLYTSQSKYNRDILYFDCPRYFFKILFKSLVKNNHLVSDNKYLTNNKEIEKSKEYYNQFLIKFLDNVKKKFSINAFIGFNFRYYAERELHSACTKSNIPFLVLHKESVVTEYEKNLSQKYT